MPVPSAAPTAASKKSSGGGDASGASVTVIVVAVILSVIAAGVAAAFAAVKLGVAGTNTSKKAPLRKALSLGQDGKKSFMGLDDIVDDGKLAERVVKIEQELATRLKNLEKPASDTAGKQDALNEGLDTTVDDVKAQMNSLQGVVDPIAIRAAELTVSRHLEQHFGGGSSVLELRHDIDAPPPFSSDAPPHLVFHDFDDGKRLAKRLKTVLQCLFPVPKADAKRVCS